MSSKQPSELHRKIVSQEIKTENHKVAVLLKI